MQPVITGLIIFMEMSFFSNKKIFLRYQFTVFSLGTVTLLFAVPLGPLT